MHKSIYYAGSITGSRSLCFSFFFGSSPADETKIENKEV